MFGHDPKLGPSIKECEFPYLPATLDLNDLDDNNMPLSHDEITEVKTAFVNDPTLERYKITTKDNKNYSIIKIPNAKGYELFLIYLGTKRNKALGKGSYAKVKIAWRLSDEMMTAVKVAFNLSPHEIELVEKEIEVLKKMDKFFGSQNRRNYARFSIIMPLEKHMSLDQFLERNLLNPYQALQVATNVIDALMKLHAMGELHCDFNPKNIMLNCVTLAVTIIDFQTCQKFPETITTKKFTPKGYEDPKMIISEIKTAGDIILTQYKYSQSSDIYALGMTLAAIFNLLTSTFLFKSSVWNTHLKDYSQIDNVLTYLQHLIYSAPADRAALKDIKTFFDTLLQEYIRKENPSKQIGIIDVTQFIKYTNLNLPGELVQALKQMHEIWFIDPEGAHAKDYYRLHRMLDKIHAKVGARLFKGSHPGLSAAAIAKQIPSLPKETQSTLRQNFYFFTAEDCPNELIYSLREAGVSVYQNMVQLGNQIYEKAYSPHF